MKPSIQFAVATLAILLVTIGHQHAAQAADFDHSKFDQILKTYVDTEGRVDYNGIAADNTFREYMRSLENAKADSLSRDGQLAFWINAYNAVTIDKVITWKPKKSVRETFVPGVWTGTKFFTSRQHTVAGQRLSQDDIEHEILRKRFQDPRIHFAIICTLRMPAAAAVGLTRPKMFSCGWEMKHKNICIPSGGFKLIMSKRPRCFRNCLTGLPVILGQIRLSNQFY